MSQTVSPREASSIARLADSVIRAGAIYSMAADRSIYRAIALRDKWIVAVSEDPHGLDGLSSAGTHVVDEPGMTIIPAFDDTHNHFIKAADDISLVQVDQARSIADVVELIRQQAVQTPAGQWIRTSNAWHESNLAEGRLPTALELDQASQDHPIWVKRGGHVGVANSMALHMAGITRESPDPPGGIIKHSSDGVLTGEFLEAPAWSLVESLIPPKPFEQLVGNLHQACLEYNAYGIGTVLDPFVTRDQLLVYQALWERSVMTLRCRPMLLISRGSDSASIADITSLGVRSGFGDDLLKIWGMVKRGTKHVGIQGPVYAIDQYTAVQLYTAASAQLNWERERRGTIQPRRLADLVAYRTNPVTCPIDDILTLRPTFTMVGGRIVYDPESLSNEEERV